MKRILSLAIAAGLLSVISVSDLAAERKWEFTVLGGYGFGARDSSASRARTWSYEFLDPVNESATIGFSQKNSAVVSVSAAYFWSPNFGVQLGIGYFGPKTASVTDWRLSWHWTDTDETFTEQGTLPEAAGRLRSFPVYLNLKARYAYGPVELSVSAGPAIYFNSVEADGFGLYSDSVFTADWRGWDQVIDAFEVPLALDKSWVGVGLDAGLGVSVSLGKGLALTAEARYFACPAKDLAWTWTQGTYNGLFGEWPNYSFSPEAATAAGNATAALQIKPSFLALMGGLSYSF